MRATQRVVVMAGFVLGLQASRAAAQHPQIREGFWINFGVGYGSAHEKCNGCSDTTVSGVTGFLRLGGTVSPHLLIGGEIQGLSHGYAAVDSFPSAKEIIGSVTASLYYYPKPASGFFLKAGLGFSDYRFTVNGSSGTVTGLGGGMIVGLGYDIRVGRNVSLTPTGDLWYGSVGDLKSGSTQVGTGWKQAVVSFGLGVTFH